MNRAPLVSVVTIFKDAERFLAESARSVLAQSCSDWELLLVDDGSSDDSREIAEGFERLCPHRIRVLEHDGRRNRGMSASRNLGIAQARGRFVALLDADDVWLPHRLEEQLALFAAHPRAAMVYGNRQYWTDGRDGGEVSDHRIPVDRLILPPELFVAIYGDQRATNPGSDVIVRRETALRLGGFDDRFRTMYEDQAFLVKVFLHEPVFVSSRCWMKYRQHDASCVARWARDGERPETSWKSFLDWIEAYVAERGIADRRVRAAVGRAMRPFRHPWLDRLARLPGLAARRARAVGTRWSRPEA